MSVRRMTAIVTSGILLCVLLLSCARAGVTDVTEADFEVSGLWLLEAVDGLDLPADVPSQDGCIGTVLGGELTLNVAMSDVLPLYSWSAGGGPERCGETVNEGVQLDDDFGSWTRGESTIHFRRYQSEDRYVGQLVGTGGVQSLLSLQRGAHTYTFRHLRRSDAPIGYIQATVVDETGALIDGAILKFLAPDGLITGGTTPLSGTFTTSGPPGEWQVTVTPPIGYLVPAAQPNPVHVTMFARATAQVRFELARSP